MRLPRARRLRRRLAIKAMPIPQKGPKVTAARMLTICCTGAHLLPATGKLIKLPTTARAVNTPASAIFFVERLVFMDNFLLSVVRCLIRKNPHLNGDPALSRIKKEMRGHL